MNYFIIFLVVAGGGYFIYWIIKWSSVSAPIGNSLNKKEVNLNFPLQKNAAPTAWYST